MEDEKEEGRRRRMRMSLSLGDVAADKRSIRLSQSLTNLIRMMEERE